MCLRNRTGLLLTAGRRGAPLRLPCLPCFVAWEWDSEVHTSHIVNNMVKLGPILGVIVQSNGGSWRWNAEFQSNLKCVPRQFPRFNTFLFLCLRLRDTKEEGDKLRLQFPKQHPRPTACLDLSSQLLSSFLPGCVFTFLTSKKR